MQIKPISEINLISDLPKITSSVFHQKIVKPIKGIQNTMKDEYILFLRKKGGIKNG